MSKFIVMCLGFAMLHGTLAAQDKKAGVEPVRPTKTELPKGPLIRLPSRNVEEPIPLPILAKPLQDRASLADPTLEASVAATRKQVQAGRTATLAFVPINLPNPFENCEAIRLRYVLEELPMPPPIFPRMPK